MSFVARRPNTPSQNRQNIRANKGYFTYNGQTARIPVLARLNGIPVDVARARLRKGWTVTETLSTAVPA